MLFVLSQTWGYFHEPAFFAVFIEIRYDLPYGMWYTVKNTKIFRERGMVWQERQSFPWGLRISWKCVQGDSIMSIKLD